MATIELFQERISTEAGHTVVNRVDATTQMEPEIFVMRTTDDTFSHVAAVDDMMVYPNAKELNKGFYRVAEVELLFVDVATAIAYATNVKCRVQALVSTYTNDVATFVGSESETFNS